MLEAAVGTVGLAVHAREKLETELFKAQAGAERESECAQQLAVAQAAVDIERGKVASAHAAADAETVHDLACHSELISTLFQQAA